MPTTPADRIIALGVALEKGRHEALVIQIPSQPGYALFRHHGLQVIPNESLEIDTGGTDTVILTSRADIVSGTLLKLASALPFPNEDPGLLQFVKRAGDILRKALKSKQPNWEMTALGEIIAHALEIANRLKPRSRGKDTHTAPRDPSTKRPGPPGIPPHIRNEFGDEVAEYLHGGGDDFSISFGWPPSHHRGLLGKRKGPQPHVLVIAGLAGKVVGNLWLPLPSATLKLTQRLICRISAELAERELDPSYAQLILGEMLARDPSQNRR